MSRLNVGIVGGGIAGLYTALLLLREGHYVRIFEGTDRIGGRVYTHYFTTEKDQYYEAGAMRIPYSEFHEIVFQLINYVNSQVSKPEEIELIDYILNDTGNDVFINDHRPEMQAFSVTPLSIGWDVPENYTQKTAQQLLEEAIGQFIYDLKENFKEAFETIVNNFDDFTFRYYCKSVMGWPDEVIDFVETVASQTNQFALSVPELVMQNMDFDEKVWKTIDGGMSRLPQAMARLVGLSNITFGARVTGLKKNEDGRVCIITSGYNGDLSATFDRVVLAIPPAALRMITDRPHWGAEKEMAIRSIHFEALYKMGLRFKTRFWERVSPGPSNGGQSTTDLPIRWVVFPSNGRGEDGPGALLVYAWMTDASNWVPLTPLERRNLAIDCIEKLYQGKLDGDKNIDVKDLLIGTSDTVWSTSTATGDAMFLPGQFRAHFDVAQRREENIYFAGEHLSYHHTWISGAANSALSVVRDMLDDNNLPPLEKPVSTRSISRMKKEALVREPAPAKVPFRFEGGRLGLVHGWPPTEVPREGSDSEYKFPTNLGMSQAGLGPVTANLKGPNAMGM
ncbi:hypothetical protein F4806DRAFT_490031 [Annulohypoxylon nitens]|nr:hypothetical protein F4806DRAFT_490031 [Annulohypoxylon nitens]